MCICAHMYACTEARGQLLVLFLKYCAPGLFLRQGLSLPRVLQIQLGWPVSPRDPLISASSALAVQVPVTELSFL